MSLVATKPVLAALTGVPQKQLPIWFMRQAGRYLPEYRALRAKSGGFLDMCYNPEKAAEVTLQPIERYGFDASILFSDILVIPDALGQDLRFEVGEGPRLGPLDLEAIAKVRPEDIHSKLKPIYETVDRVKDRLPSHTTFIGFCGAPWTVASYMIAGRGGDDQEAARSYYYQSQEAMDQLLKIIADASIAYLIKQIDHGVEAIQIFESWAGNMTFQSFQKHSAAPISYIIKGVREKYPDIPIITFAKGASQHLAYFQDITKANGQGLDWTVDIKACRSKVGQNVALQGNLDPLALIAGGAALDEAVDEILENAENTPFIFNLGHGIRQTTPLDHVQQVIDRIRKS